MFPYCTEWGQKSFKTKLYEKKKTFFCKFILTSSVYLSQITSVVSDTLISERVDMLQFYIFDVSFLLKNGIILVMLLLNTLDNGKCDFAKLMFKQSFKGISLLKISRKYARILDSRSNFCKPSTHSMTNIALRRLISEILVFCLD